MISSEHIKKIVNKQFKIAKYDLTFEDVQNTPKWYVKYPCTQEENEKWKNWTCKYLKEKLKFTKDKAFIYTSWLDLSFGLKVLSKTSAKKSSKK